MLLLTKDADDIFKLELQNSEKQKKKFSKFPVPPFSVGEEYLGFGKNFLGLPFDKKIEYWTKDWFQNPQAYLRLKDESLVYTEGDFICFPSILDKSQLARFQYSAQPVGTPGNKVALIHVMHWNARLSAYDKVIKFIRNTGLPISTLIHIPAGRGLNPGTDAPSDYRAVSPNVGLTVFQTRQDVYDLQMMAKYLKKNLGYKQVGLFSYSIGSLRAMIAAMVNPGLFDFGVFHLVADDYTEAFMNGIATEHMAKLVKGKIDNKLLSKIWSTISPGAYKDFFKFLPPSSRVVQAEYDYVFGPNNVKRFTEKIKKVRPDIELEIVPTSHSTFGYIPLGAEVMWRDLKFIYNHTDMKQYKRSKLFI